MKLYPCWIILYWWEASHLLILKRKWMRAEQFLLKHRVLCSLSGQNSAYNVALNILYNLVWSGNINGFSNNDPVTSLTTYLSQTWLGQLHEVVDDFFFVLLQTLYRHRKSNEYLDRKNNYQRYWEVGNKLASGVYKTVCGIANIDNKHWVAIGIDGTKNTIFYGDSTGDLNSDSINEQNLEVIEALKWWIKIHTDIIFTCSNMAISRQNDGFSCGVLALNSLRTFLLPSVALVPECEVIMECVKMFTLVARCHMESSVDEDVFPEVTALVTDSEVLHAIPIYASKTSPLRIVHPTTTLVESHYWVEKSERQKKKAKQKCLLVINESWIVNDRDDYVHESVNKILYLKTIKLQSQIKPKTCVNIAEVSRPHRSFKEDLRDENDGIGWPRKPENSYMEAKYMNWTNPLIYIHIDEAARKLKPQTLGRWIDQTGDRPRWNDAFMCRVVAGNKPGGLTTRVGVLIKYPEATQAILKYLNGL
ncbi:hypothetical protein BDQ17DRAFT_1323607 [Cyathus striatus]|nr:hypothetical protein BDQ17DRAFT_1323607 [Cyathus striatus]